MMFFLFEWCSWQMKKFIDEKHISQFAGYGLPTHWKCFSVLWRWGKLPRSFMTILHHTHLGHMLSTSTSQIPLLGPSAGLYGSQMSLRKLIEMYMEFSTQTTLFKTRLKEKKGRIRHSLKRWYCSHLDSISSLSPLIHALISSWSLWKDVEFCFLVESATSD
jgi:hypothetical protein